MKLNNVIFPHSKAAGGAMGSSYGGGIGSQQVHGVAKPLRGGWGGNEGLMGDSDNWVAGLVEDWRTDCRDKQIPRINTKSLEVVWRGGGRGRLDGTIEFILAAFGGLMLLILTVWVILAGNWVVSGTGVVVHCYDGEWRHKHSKDASNHSTNSEFLLIWNEVFISLWSSKIWHNSKMLQ